MTCEHQRNWRELAVEAATANARGDRERANVVVVQAVGQADDCVHCITNFTIALLTELKGLQRSEELPTPTINLN